MMIQEETKNKKKSDPDPNYTDNILSVIHTSRKTQTNNVEDCLLYLKYCIVCGDLFTSYYVSTKTCCYICSKTATNIKNKMAATPYQKMKPIISKSDRVKFAKMGFKIPL